MDIKPTVTPVAVVSGIRSPRLAAVVVGALAARPAVTTLQPAAPRKIEGKPSK